MSPGEWGDKPQSEGPSDGLQTWLDTMPKFSAWRFLALVAPHRVQQWADSLGANPGQSRVLWHETLHPLLPGKCVQIVAMKGLL